MRDAVTRLRQSAIPQKQSDPRKQKQAILGTSSDPFPLIPVVVANAVGTHEQRNFKLEATFCTNRCRGVVISLLRWTTHLSLNLASYLSLLQMLAYLSCHHYEGGPSILRRIGAQAETGPKRYLPEAHLSRSTCPAQIWGSDGASRAAWSPGRFGPYLRRRGLSLSSQ